MSAGEVSNTDRMQAVHSACTVAFDQAYMAYARADRETRKFWIDVQTVCSLELQDCVAADMAGVP